MTALAEPAIFLARRPTAQRAADARAGRLVALLFVKLTNDGGILGDWTHEGYYGCADEGYLL